MRFLTLWILFKNIDLYYSFFSLNYGKHKIYTNNVKYIKKTHLYESNKNDTNNKIIINDSALIPKSHLSKYYNIKK